MASRVSSVSSISSVSSSARRTVDFESERRTPAAAVSTGEVENPKDDQTVAAGHIHQAVTTEPLLQRRDSIQQGEQIANYEIKDPAEVHRRQYGKRPWDQDWWFCEIA